ARGTAPRPLRRRGRVPRRERRRPHGPRTGTPPSCGGRVSGAVREAGSSAGARGGSYPAPERSARDEQRWPAAGPYTRRAAHARRPWYARCGPPGVSEGRRFGAQTMQFASPRSIVLALAGAAMALVLGVAQALADDVDDKVKAAKE